MPPFLGGGEMIRDVRLDGFTTNDVPWKFEAGTHADRRGRRLRRRGRLPRPRSAWTRCATTRCALTRYALDALRDRFGDRLTIYGPLDTRRARRRGLVPLRRHPRPRHQPGARRGRRVRAGRPPLRQAADAPARRPGHDPGVVLRVQRRSRRRRARRSARQGPEVLRASRQSRRHDGRPRRPLPRDHPRPLPLAAEPRRAPGAARAQGRGLQPAVRRRGRALPRRRPRHRHRRAT